MMFTKLSDRVFAGFTYFTLAVFATLDSSYPAATYPFLWAHLPHVQGSGRSSGLEVTISGNIFVKPYDSAFICKPSLSGAYIHSCC